MSRMNYNPTYPMDEVEGPMVVQNAESPSDTFQDYIPRREKRERIVKRGKERDCIDDSKIYLEDAEYRTARDQEKVRDRRIERSKKVVKQVLLQYKQKLQSFSKAVAHCQAATEDEMKNPDQKLETAMAIKKKGPPITLEQAKEKAIQIIMNQECRS